MQLSFRRAAPLLLLAALGCGDSDSDPAVVADPTALSGTWSGFGTQPTDDDCQVDAAFDTAGQLQTLQYDCTTSGVIQGPAATVSGLDVNAYALGFDDGSSGQLHIEDGLQHLLLSAQDGSFGVLESGAANPVPPVAADFTASWQGFVYAIIDGALQRLSPVSLVIATDNSVAMTMNTGTVVSGTFDGLAAGRGACSVSLATGTVTGGATLWLSADGQFLGGYNWIDGATTWPADYDFMLLTRQ